MLDSTEPGPINLGNPVELTVREIAELVRESTGSRSEIQFRPLPQDDPTRRRPDITLARTRLGWYPQVLVQDGIMQTIEWHARNLNAELAS
jgi:dTDP-glucose 4,6-dehydratase